MEGFWGFGVLRVMAARNKIIQQHLSDKPDILRQNKIMIACGAGVNLLIVVFFCFAGYWPAALAWMGGVGIIFPFLLSLRQVLEHRDYHASPWFDYTKVEHGEVSRMFDNGILGSTFGSAGFNRHLLHHWDPQVPCTRLRELESFLKDTEAGKGVQENKVGYLFAFLKLFNH